jgi:methylthioribulose-1-phosphate dehydratase
MIESRVEKIAEDIVSVGQLLNRLGLFPATAGNLSCKCDENVIAITASGKHKGELSVDDILLVDFEGNPLQAGPKPSHETLIHTALYQWDASIGAILHTHSVDATVLTRLDPHRNMLKTKNYQLHLVFPGIASPESELLIPIFENDQHIPSLMETALDQFERMEAVYGFLLRGHGLFTWGRDLQEARYRVEALEFIFSCELKLAQMPCLSISSTTS